MFMQIFRKTLIKGILLLCATTAIGAELKVATPNTPSIDPHFLYISTNAAFARHVFGKLVDLDQEARLLPDLAESWVNVDPLTWEFKLRRNVKFHDGSEFTAQDVISSFKRVPSVPNNPASYESNTNMIESITAKDPYAIVIKTKTPYPLLLRRISGVSIVPKAVAEKATTADFTSGIAAIGTGPYKFMKYLPGDRYVLGRNESYWGTKPPYETVTFKIMSDAPSRIAALIGGDVDIVEGFTPMLESRKGFYVAKRASARTMWLYVDTMNDVSPFVTDIDGKPMAKNPLKDKRVREALSIAIDRKTIVSRIMDGLAEEAGQLVPMGWFSHNPEIKTPVMNIDAAKKM